MTIENKNIDLLYSDLTLDLYNLYKKSSYLAIDTEAMGLIHGRDRLCLVPVSYTHLTLPTMLWV